MPNWCEGTLKVRGKIKDLKRFCLEGLHPVDYFGNDQKPSEIDEYGEFYHEGTMWIENSDRGFVESPRISFSDLCADDEEEVCIIMLENASFAWGIEAEDLLKTCIKYNVDMRIYGFERGTESNQEIEIVDGKITLDRIIEFDDYQWECPCPNIGG